MASSEGRRSFLLGVTLNELSFIMFFLLMFISAATLQKSSSKLKQEIQQKTRLEQQLVAVRQERDGAFKRLQLLESQLMRAGGFSSRPSEQQLQQWFTKLQAVKSDSDLQQKIVRLQNELESYQQLDALMRRSGLAGKPVIQLEQLIQQTQQSSKQLQSLKGRVAYMQKKLKNTGLGYPPCWADLQTGTVEYLYSITLYEQYMRIEAAWPAHRKVDLGLIPEAEKLVGKNLTQQQLQQRLKPILNWSKAHGCRHFVRIKDDQYTSKQAFKQQMLIIEDYFYKYLVR